MKRKVGSLLVRPFILGASVLLVVLVLLAPLLILAKNFSFDPLLGLFLLLIFVVLSILIGHVSLNRRLPLVSSGAKFFLNFSADLYREFLIQAARYFCEENTTEPFSEVVKVSLGNGATVLAFKTNQLEDNLVVFIPTSLNLGAGFVALVSKEMVEETPIPPEELVKFALTSGASGIELQ